MDVVDGIDALLPAHGPAFAVVGVFDGLHLGHQYLLRHLVEEAAARDARPTVITFDHHPDEILTGHAPALLLDPAERLTRLAAAGVAVTVVQPFDSALRMTPYDAFIERIRARLALFGMLMTPDSAFGHQRAGTPAAVAELGRRDGFDVVLVEPFIFDRRPLSSSAIRAALTVGDLVAAAAMLGRPMSLVGRVEGDNRHGRRLVFDLPIALPPDGDYDYQVVGQTDRLSIENGRVYLGPGPLTTRLRIELIGPAATAAP